MLHSTALAENSFHIHYDTRQVALSHPILPFPGFKTYMAEATAHTRSGKTQYSVENIGANGSARKVMVPSSLRRSTDCNHVSKRWMMYR